jgi:HAD superfamily hydrolase (TIGR01509 family)
MEKKRYKAIIFDLDGTLIDSLQYHIMAFKDLLLERGIKVSNFFIKQHIGKSTKKILIALKKKYSLKENVGELYEERRYHYFKFLGNRNIVFPRTQDLMMYLKTKDYKIAIATGSSETTFIHSTQREFQVLFDAVITINDVRKGKPYPDQLLLASRKLRVKPSECLIIGDSIYDALAAKRAKMDFVGVSTGETSARELRKAGALNVLEKLSELKKFLNEKK